MEHQDRNHPFYFPGPRTPPPPPPPPHHPSPDDSFPVLAISIVGILTTSILLLSYYIFVIRCCLVSWHHPDILIRLSRSRRTRLAGDQSRSAAYSTTVLDYNGLDESAIRAIPTLRFRHTTESSFRDCAVCLNEFQEEEKIRMLPNCYHAFHVDCIDTWLQNHVNCPLCRADIAAADTPIPIIRCPDFGLAASVAIEVRHDQGTSAQETQSSENASNVNAKARKEKHKVTSLGDECINLRGKDEFGVQPMRRSFSMDSSNDTQLYMAVQEILRQSRHAKASSGEGSSSGGGGGSGKSWRPFFSFGRGSRTAAILPVRQAES